MNLKDKTALIFDHGLFESFAQKLGESFGKVLYYCEWKTGFPESRRAAIGKDMPNIERVMDFDDHIEESDVIVFPDIYSGDRQVSLRAEGKRVWGSGKAEELEIERFNTKKFLEKVGLPVGKYRKITGIPALREYLKSNDDKWVKLEAYRGDSETFHAQNYKLIEPKLNEMEFKLGPMGKKMVFIVEDPLEAVSEWGYDGYTIDGQFPTIGIQGVEKKNESYVAIVRPYDKLLKQLRLVNAKMAPALKGYECRGAYSTEVRIAKDGKGYFTDPCMRCASPAGECYQELFGNWGDIVWAGSDGELIDPKPTAKYAVEVLINCDAGGRNWVPIHFPKEIEQWVKLRNATRIDGEYNIANQDQGTVQIGAVVATGDTLLDACRKIAGYCKKIEGFAIEIKLESICGAIDAVRESEAMGMDVADDKIPSQEEVAKALGL